MQARSALFDLYGDYLRPRGGRAPVAALVRLLAPLGIAAPAVRTAISRMVRQGWLLPVRQDGSPGYQLSIKAVHRLDEAASRIYRTAQPPWGGQFDLIVLEPPESRAARARLTATLAYLGYGSLDGATWIAPRGADEVERLLCDAGVKHDRFTAAHAAGQPGAAALVRRAWDLATLASAYEQFVADQTPAMLDNAVAYSPDTARANGANSGGRPAHGGVGAAGGGGSSHGGANAAHGGRDGQGVRPSADELAYAARFRLVHAWRSFLFRDPQLPPALLPSPWPGQAAAEFFDHHEARLRPAADRFVDRSLSA